MKKVGIVYLITEKPEAKGVLDTATETRRKTYCEEKSLSMSEVYQARASGFLPVYRLRLPQDFEYKGETLCEYKGERYEIIRDYGDEKTGNSTELTIQRRRGNASSETAQELGTETPAEETEPEEGAELTPAEEIDPGTGAEVSQGVLDAEAEGGNSV